MEGTLVIPHFREKETGPESNGDYLKSTWPVYLDSTETGWQVLLESSHGQALLNTIELEQGYMDHGPLLVHEDVTKVKNLISQTLTKQLCIVVYSSPSSN